MVGDVVNDVVVRPLVPVSVGSDTRSSITDSPGGQGANQAAWLGALGVPCRFASRVGVSDAQLHRVALEQFGVDTRLTVDDERPTGAIVVLSQPNGERTMFTDPGASSHLQAADLPPTLLEGACLVHLSAYSLFTAGSRQPVLDLCRAASGTGLPLSVDPASVSCLQDVGSSAFFDWTAGFTFFFPNLAEARLLVGEGDPPRLAQRLLERYPVVALKLGADGAVVASRDEGSVSIPAWAATVLDTTGAGDAFCAGFIGAWVEGAGLRAAGVAGVEAAALCVAAAGGRPARAQVGSPPVRSKVHETHLP